MWPFPDRPSGLQLSGGQHRLIVVIVSNLWGSYSDIKVVNPVLLVPLFLRFLVDGGALWWYKNV